jgi:hypothetical protein
VIRQHAGKYVQQGRWLVPARIELRTQMCPVTLDFTRAVITSSVLRIDADMVHGKLFIVSPPGIMISTGGLILTYSKLKLHPRGRCCCRSPSPHRARGQSRACKGHRAAASEEEND